MINIGELTRALSMSVEDAGVPVSRVVDEPPRRPPGAAPAVTVVGHRFSAHLLPPATVLPAPRCPELYLG